MPKVLSAIDAMSTAEKVQTMDYLWTSLESSGQAYPTPAWHKEELERRKALYAMGNVPTYDWENIKSRLFAHREVV